MSTFRRLLHTLLSFSLLATLLAWPPAAPPAQAAGLISGTVYQDYNANGTQDAASANPNAGAGTYSAAIDTGLGNVTVTAYDASGAFVSTVTAISGTYTLDTAGLGVGPYRVEFTNLPAGYQPGPFGADNGTTVRIVDGNTSGVDLGLNYPADYCQDNPQLAVPCYVKGDQLTGPNRFQSVLESFPYSSGSNGAVISAYDNPLVHTFVISATQIGTTWGLAQTRYPQRLFAAAYMKKHTGFGPGGPGAVYVIDRLTATVVATYTVPGAVTDPHNPANYQTDNGNVTWNAVGKVSLGGLAMSDDETRLYVMNLENRTLYALDPATGAVLASQAVPLNPPLGAGTCPAGDVRPFAVEFYHGGLYVGMLCTAESSQNAAHLQAYVYTVDPLTLAFGAAPAFQAALNYPRGRANGGPTGQLAAWNPWAPTFRALPPNIGDPSWDFPVYPQPLFTSLSFMNGDLVIGLRDRFGDQTGNRAPDNEADFGALYHGITAGDTLLACANGSGGWTLESNGRCGTPPRGSAPQNTGQGPGSGALAPLGYGEFFFADDYSVPTNSGAPHDEVTVGGLLHVPGFPDLVVTAFDPVPINDPDTIFDGGFRWFNSDGGLTKAYRLRNGSPGDPITFGKGNGLGDMIALCDAAPIEVGNVVWLDTDKDGVQDPDENPIAGVTVRLYAPDGVTVLATATTDANGQYYFSNAAGASTGNAVYGIAGLTPNTPGYSIRLDNSANYTGTAPLAGLTLTVADADSDIRDSDGQLDPGDGFPRITFNTGGPGANNHTYDFGFFTNTTAAELLYFRLSRLAGGGVALSWATAAEVDVAGYQLYRAPAADFGQAQWIHFTPAARAPGGGVYTFTDTPVGAGPWWYWLEEISTTGAPVRYPPVTTANSGLAQPFALFLPMVRR